MLKLVVDRLKNPVQILIDVIVPETQYLEALVRELHVARAVANGMRVDIVLAAIDFDNHPMPKTNEIEDSSVAGRLTTEMITAGSP